MISNANKNANITGLLFFAATKDSIFRLDPNDLRDAFLTYCHGVGNHPEHLRKMNPSELKTRFKDMKSLALEQVEDAFSASVERKRQEELQSAWRSPSPKPC